MSKPWQESLIAMKQAKADGIIPSAYVPLLNDVCEHPDCGQDLLVRPNLTLVTCSDIKCPIKQKVRGSEMLKNFGIMGIGPEFCEAYYKHGNYKSHLSLFLGIEEDYEVPGNMKKGRDLYEAVMRIRNNNSYTFGQLVSLLGLPYFDESAQKVFYGFISLEDFEDFLDRRSTDMLTYISNLNGFGYIAASQAVTTIENFRKELEALPHLFNIKFDCLETIDIIVTGDIINLPYAFNRDQFGRYLNGLGEGIVRVKIGKAHATAEYVVADRKSTSQSYETGLLRNILVTSDQMVDIVKARVDEIKERAKKWLETQKQITL